MMTTRSEIPVPEYGMIFADDSGVFWNTVDTLFSPQTIQTVRASYPSIDFLLTTWHVSLEGKYQYNQSLSFPFSLYGQLFNLISLVQPKAIAPGAQGFKYIKESSWQNQVVFPVTRERLCQDLKIAFPEIGKNIFTLDPGDILTFDKGDYHYLAGSCEFAKKVVDDRECIDFSPVNVGVELVDPNPENYDVELMRQTLYEEISLNLPQFITENRTSIFNEHCRWQVIYQLEVVFSGGSQKWYIDFSQETIQVLEGRNPLANFFTYITASSLYSLIQKKRDWDYLICSGEYRSFHKVYSLTRLGIIYQENSPIQDPIGLKFPLEYIAGANVKAEVKKWLDSNRDFSQVNEDENPMLIMGKNLLIKRRKKSKITS
jgi:hypothetical protein